MVATPHVAGNTEEVAGHQGASVASALEQMLRGQRPETLLNPQTLTAFGWTGERRKPTEAELEGLPADYISGNKTPRQFTEKVGSSSASSPTNATCKCCSSAHE